MNKALLMNRPLLMLGLSRDSPDSSQSPWPFKGHDNAFSDMEGRGSNTKPHIGAWALVCAGGGSQGEEAKNIVSESFLNAATFAQSGCFWQSTPRCNPCESVLWTARSDARSSSTSPSSATTSG